MSELPVALYPAIAAVLVALIGVWRSHSSSSADAIQKLTLSVSSLTDDLESEKKARKVAELEFRKQLAASKQEAEERIARIVAKHAVEIREVNERIKSLEVENEAHRRENHSLLVENRRLGLLLQGKED